MQPFTTLTGLVAPLPIKDVDTDMIIPAQFLTRISSEGYADALFRRLREEQPDFALNQPRFAAASILAAGSNFGCGSSREHAVWALRDAGFRAVISASFADIFAGNAAKNGLVLITLPAARMELLLRSAGDGSCSVTIDLERQTVSFPDGSSEQFPFDPFRKHCIMRGLDDLDYLLEHRDEIARFRRAGAVHG